MEWVPLKHLAGAKQSGEQISPEIYRRRLLRRLSRQKRRANVANRSRRGSKSVPLTALRPALWRRRARVLMSRLVVPPSWIPPLRLMREPCSRHGQSQTVRPDWLSRLVAGRLERTLRSFFTWKPRRDPSQYNKHCHAESVSAFLELYLFLSVWWPRYNACDAGILLAPIHHPVVQHHTCAPLIQRIQRIKSTFSTKKVILPVPPGPVLCSFGKSFVCFQFPLRAATSTLPLWKWSGVCWGNHRSLWPLHS